MVDLMLTSGEYTNRFAPRIRIPGNQPSGLVFPTFFFMRFSFPAPHLFVESCAWHRKPQNSKTSIQRGLAMNVPLKKHTPKRADVTLMTIIFNFLTALKGEVHLLFFCKREIVANPVPRFATTKKGLLK